MAGRGLRRVLGRRGMSPGSQFAIVKIARYLLNLVGIIVAVDSIGLNLLAVLAASTVLLVGIGLLPSEHRPELRVRVDRSFRATRTSGRLHQGRRRLRDCRKHRCPPATRVVTRDQATIIVPNSELVNTQVINHSIPTPNLRFAVSVGVAYGTNTELVRKTLLAVPLDISRCCRSRPPR